MTVKQDVEIQTEKIIQTSCENCNKEIKEDNNITWYHYNPFITCNTSNKWLVESTKEYADTRTDHDTFSNALNIHSIWVVGICNECLIDEEVIEKSHNNSKSEKSGEQELDDITLPENGNIVNSKVVDFQTTEKEVDKYYCDICGTQCNSYHTMVNDLSYRINKEETNGSKRRPTCYVSRNWYGEEEPDWKDVVEIKYDSELHLCDSCYGDLRPKMVKRLQLKLVSLTTRILSRESVKL